MNTNIISVNTHTDQEQVAHLFRKYDLIAMPVLDSDGCLVGIVTFDDAMDVMVDETNEDISRMAAMEPNEKTYFETTVWQQAKHRILWLLVLMFSATITGSIITRYENAFSAVPLLVSFIPMLMDTGGNCGSQSSTLIIRGLALGEIHFKEIFKVMFKEFRISLVVGFILAAANGLRIFIQYQNFNIAIVVALSLMVVVIVAKLIGCILPLFANKIGVEHLAFGFDFCEFLDDEAAGSFCDQENPFTVGLEDCTHVPAMVEKMKKAGFSDKELEMICRGNWMNLIQRVIG